MSQAPRGGARMAKGELYALLAATTYALNNVFSGIAVQGRGLNFLVAVTLRALPTLLIAAAIGWSGRRARPGTVSPFSDWRLLAALLCNGLLTFVIGGPLQFAALEEGGVVISTPLLGTQVLWAAIIAAIFLRESFNRRMAAGMLVSVAGITLLAWGKSGGVALSPTWWLAVPYATAAALCWSASGVLITYTMRRGVDRFQGLTIAVFSGLLCTNLYLLATGDMAAYAATPQNLLVSVAIAGVFGAVALISITSAMAFTTVASANAINTLQVGLAPLISWAFVGELLDPLMAAGIALIMVGVILVQVTRPVWAEPAGTGSDS